MHLATTLPTTITSPWSRTNYSITSRHIRITYPRQSLPVHLIITKQTGHQMSHLIYCRRGCRNATYRFSPMGIGPITIRVKVPRRRSRHPSHFHPRAPSDKTLRSHNRSVIRHFCARTQRRLSLLSQVELFSNRTHKTERHKTISLWAATV